MGNQYAKEQAKTLQNAARYNQENAAKVADGDITVGDGWAPAISSSTDKQTYTIYGAPAYSLEVKTGANVLTSLSLNCMSKVETIPGFPGALQISALEKGEDGSTLTVDLTAKVADTTAATKFQESFRSVVESFHTRVGAHELEDGVVLREGWLVKYPKIGRPRKRFFSLAKTVKGTKIDSFLSLYYFVDESKTVMKGMYPLNKFCKASVLTGTDPTRFVWESQHVSRAGKATDKIRVELKASNAVQATSWANLINFLANLEVNENEISEKADEQAPESLRQDAAITSPEAALAKAIAAGGTLGSHYGPTTAVATLGLDTSNPIGDEELALRLAEALGKGAAAATQPSGDTSVSADIERAFFLGQTSGDIARALSLGQTWGATITSDGDTPVDVNNECAFLLGQTSGGIERAFSRGQALGAAITSDVDKSFVVGIDSAFWLGERLGGVESAFLLGQTSGATITSDGGTPFDVNNERAFLLGQTSGGIERAFSRGQALGAVITSDVDKSVGFDIGRAILLGQNAYAFTQGRTWASVARAFVQGQAFAEQEPVDRVNTAVKVDAEIERAFWFGQLSSTKIKLDIEGLFLLGETQSRGNPGQDEYGFTDAMRAGMKAANGQSKESQSQQKSTGIGKYVIMM